VSPSSATAERAAAHLRYLLRIADTSLILGQRLSEWVGHAPALEEDLGLANIALDLIGQARLLLSYAAQLEGRGRSEDALAFLRDASGFFNVALAEQPNGDFGCTIVRQFLLSAYQLEVYEALQASSDARLAEIAAKGGTPGDFREAANRLTTAAGAEKLNAFTLDTAFNTAMQKSYSSGRLVQMREPHMTEAFPAWQYWTVGDLRVRPEHAVLDGFIARAIDPVWIKIYPPSGFNCRCSVVPVTEEDAEKIDPQWSEGGLERLPILAAELVPQHGFHSLIHAA